MWCPFLFKFLRKSRGWWESEKQIASPSRHFLGNVSSRPIRSREIVTERRCNQSLKHVVQRVVWTDLKTRSLEYLISIVMPYNKFPFLIVLFEKRRTNLPKWKGWSSKVMQVSREGAWIHLQQKLKALAFTRWNFFNCLLKIMIANATAMLQINE